jgi:hypothetical protein
MCPKVSLFSYGMMSLFSVGGTVSLPSIYYTWFGLSMFKKIFFKSKEISKNV